MKRILTGLIITALIAGCTTSERNQKTPQTQVGQLNSCMLREIYNRHDSNRLNGNNWTIAQEVLNHCLHQLKITPKEINHTQSINIAVSVLESLK